MSERTTAPGGRWRARRLKSLQRPHEARLRGLRNGGEMLMREPFTRLYVHLVWATWDRMPLIGAEIEGALYSCIRAEAASLGAEVVAIGGTEDQVHVPARLPTTVDIASLVKQMKGASSHLVARLPGAPDFFRWQGGYGAFTASSWDVPRVRAYIRRQRQHHQTGTLSATLERIAAK